MCGQCSERKYFLSVAGGYEGAIRKDEQVQRSLWHEEACTQAQYPGRILCDYGTPRQRLAERNEAHFQGALSQTRGRVFAAGAVEIYARATRLHVVLLLSMRSYPEARSKCVTELVCVNLNQYRVRRCAHCKMRVAHSSIISIYNFSLRFSFNFFFFLIKHLDKLIFKYYYTSTLSNEISAIMSTDPSDPICVCVMK